LFYFASFEGSLDRQSASRLLTIPTATIRRGRYVWIVQPIYDPLTGNTDGSNRTAFPNKLPARLPDRSHRDEDHDGSARD